MASRDSVVRDASCESTANDGGRTEHWIALDWLHEASWTGIGDRGTPTISDEGLFAVGPQGMLVCLDPISGQEIWKRDLCRDATRTPPMWGFSSSPLVVDGMVMVHAGGKGDAGVFAYDASSGDIRWKSASGVHSYSSPQIAKFYNQPGILMATNSGLQFLKVADGATIWNHDWVVDNYRAIQSFVIGNEILLASSLGAGTRKLSISKIGKSWNADYRVYARNSQEAACFEIATK